MPVLTTALPEALLERLRRTAKERYSGQKGAISRILTEALEIYFTRAESSIESVRFRALKGQSVVAEASSLDALAEQLRKKGQSPRNLRIISSKKLELVAKAGFRARRT